MLQDLLLDLASFELKHFKIQSIVTNVHLTKVLLNDVLKNMI